MLAAENTLKGNIDLDSLMSRGKLFQEKDFGAIAVRREDEGPSRFGVVISKKISPLATQRNKIKRIFHEIIRHNLAEVKRGCDVVFLVRKSIIGKSTEDIMREVEIFLKSENFKKWRLKV